MKSRPPQELIVTLGTIGDRVWLDTNGNGLQKRRDRRCGCHDQPVGGSGNKIGTGYTTTTDGTGNYLFTGLLPRTYTVQFVAPSGKVFTLRNVGANDGIDSDANTVDGKTGIYTLALTPAVGDGPATVGSDLTADAGLFAPISSSGVKVWDVDRDGANGGINDAGDQRLAGLRVYLDTIDNNTFDYTDANGNQVFDSGDTALEQFTTTGANGAFSFTNIGPGTYDVREDLSSLDSAEWQPTAGTPVAYTIAAVSGTNVTDANFYNHKFSLGEYQTYSQGGYRGNGAPGQYLLANFAAAFASGLVVPRAVAGVTNDIVLLSGAEVQAFLKANNQNKFSNGTVTNYVPSNLETQFVALSLSLGFDAYDEAFSTGTANLGDLKLCNLTGQYAVANDLTVSEYLAQVAFYLDGSVSYTLGLSSGDLTVLLNQITLGFDAGAVTTWAEMHLC